MNKRRELLALEIPTGDLRAFMRVGKANPALYLDLGGSSAPAPDPGQAAAAEASVEVAKIQRQTAQDYLDFSKQQYAELKPLAQKIYDEMLATSEQQRGIATQNEERAKEYSDYEKSTYRPLEKSLVADAESYNTDAKREELASRGMADVAQAYAAQRQQAMDTMAKYGINPNSARFAAINAQLNNSEAGAKAGAATNARTQAEQLGYARKLDAASLGRNLSSNASTAYGVSLNAGNAASSNASSALSTYGAPGSQMGNAYGQTSNIYGGATNAYGTAGNIYGQQFNAQMQAYAADQQASGAMMGALGNIAGAGLGAWLKPGSSKNIKKNKTAIADGKALDGVNKLKVEAWDYKDGEGDGGRHIGPYAEDFSREFGGDDKAISLQDAIGVTMKAVQDLSAKVDRIEAKKGGLKKANGGKVHRGGGAVRGPGGPVDDKIPAMLSNGEYVLPADTAKAVGKDKLDKLVANTHTPAAVQRRALKGGQ